MHNLSKCIALGDMSSESSCPPDLFASPTLIEQVGQRTLVNDNIKFNIDDSNDSLHQFINNRDENNLDDSDLIDFQLNSGTPCRSLKFCSSPSEPVTRCSSSQAAAQGLHKLQSAPAFRRQKRQSPDILPQQCSSSAQTSSKPGTPKRARLLGPLSDITNRQVSVDTSSPCQKPLCISTKRRGTATARPTLQRCSSECVGSWRLDSAKIDNAIASIDSLNLVGNSQQQHSLPTVNEMNYGIRYVTPDTVSRLLKGELKSSASQFKIIDCRYPFEFNGGHIRGAVNIFTSDDLIKEVMNNRENKGLIFHCEFSSERAPKLARFLRERDRQLNSVNFPELFFPEVYVLQGGYKSFYESYKSLCVPENYTKMADPMHQSELSKWQKHSRAIERQNSKSRHSQLERLANKQQLLL